MAKQVCDGALLMCNKGLGPLSLSVTPTPKVKANGSPAATIMDHKPNNIKPSGTMCTTTTNPQVSQATAAAQGVLTPMPCSPKVLSPWSQGSKNIKYGNLVALNDSSKCKCMWTGEISVTMPTSPGPPPSVDIP